MNADELVKLLDSYMGNDGYYIKPSISEDGESFFIAKGTASAGDVEKSFSEIKDVLKEKAEKKTELFSGTPTVECAVCADIPNLSIEG